MEEVLWTGSEAGGLWAEEGAGEGAERGHGGQLRRGVQKFEDGGPECRCGIPQWERGRCVARLSTMILGRWLECWKSGDEGGKGSDGEWRSAFEGAFWWSWAMTFKISGLRSIIG